MGADNQSKDRQAGRSLRRKKAFRKSADRLLIVCEGSKTEPQYLNEIRQELRLPTAQVLVLGARDGNSPIQVVEFAEKIFVEGDPQRKIQKGEFDRIVAVFDRDDHESYHQALHRAERLNMHLKNDAKLKIPFEIAASVPCFELWLLLHFEDVLSPVHRNDTYQRIKTYLPSYDKGQTGLWGLTKESLASSTQRAKALASKFDRFSDEGPYTDMHTLVHMLLSLLNRPQK